MTLKELLDTNKLTQAWVAREVNVNVRNFRDMVAGRKSFPKDVQQSLPHLLRQQGIRIPDEVMRFIFNQCRAPRGFGHEIWHWHPDRQARGPGEFCVLKEERGWLPRRDESYRTEQA